MPASDQAPSDRVVQHIGDCGLDAFVAAKEVDPNAGLAALGVVLEEPVLLCLPVAGVLDQAAIVICIEGDEGILRRVGREDDDLLLGALGGTVPAQDDAGVQQLGLEVLGVGLG